MQAGAGSDAVRSGWWWWWRGAGQHHYLPDGRGWRQVCRLFTLRCASQAVQSCANRLRECRLFAQAGHGPAEDSLRPASWPHTTRYAQPPLIIRQRFPSCLFAQRSLRRGLTLAWSAQGQGWGRRRRNWRRGGARACWRLLKMLAGRRRGEGRRERRARTVSSGGSATAASCSAGNHHVM